jgi:two-component system NtrC family response regulator
MIHIRAAEAQTQVPKTTVIVFVLLMLAFALSVAAVFQVFAEYDLLGEWEAKPGMVTTAAISALHRDIGVRIIVRSTASTVLFPEMIDQSAEIREVDSCIRQVADTDLMVLIQGVSGKGKELIARAIHSLSPRRNGSLIAVNVGALPETLIESELFGYEKGAFSGAHRQKLGWFEMAQHGTLFLDEVGEMAAKTQVDLLRVLEQQKLRRLGGEALIPLDVRLVTATHRDVDELLAEGKLRHDLYYRLNVVPLRLPPLRERRDDVPLLVEHFLQRACAKYRREPKAVAGAAMRILCDYSWPGNIRQLRNCVERLVATVEAPAIRAADLPKEMHALPRPGTLDLDGAVQETEKSIILEASARCDNHRERTAQTLGISVRTLRYKMNRYSLQ